MALRTKAEGFAPVWAPSAKAIILGSYPSVQSVANGFYYGNPHNRFWPLLAHLLNQPLPQSIEEKKDLLLSNHLALWDSLASCEIEGASDASINAQTAVPNDIGFIVRQAKINSVFCNGAAAHKFYRRFCEESTGIQAVLLPSTSPANAAYTMPRLQQAWIPVVESLR